MSRTLLDVVTFDNDVRGPGSRREAQFSSTFARDRQGVEMEHDSETGWVVIRHAKATERKVVLVRQERVLFAEPLEPRPIASASPRTPPVASKKAARPAAPAPKAPTPPASPSPPSAA